MSKYFAPAEFRACNPPCTIEDMNAGFLEQLDRVREQAGIPMVLNCAFRSVAHEKQMGRSGNSAHTRGWAVDVRCTTSANRYRIVGAALRCGIRRIGIGKTYIHLDNDGTLPQDVMWDYYV